MAWPHYPYVEATYDRLNKLYKIANSQSAAAADHLAYPSRTNYQKVALFADLQTAIRSIIPANWKIKKNYDGATSFDAITWSYCVTNAPLPQGDWTRKYYREVHDNTDTVEIFGSANGGTPQAVANGQRAYRRSDQQIVDRVAGAWVPNTTAREADIITTGGKFSEGDIIGDWLFTEMNAVMDLLGTIGTGGTWQTISAGFINASDPAGYQATSAAEHTAVETAYDSATPTTSDTTPYAHSTMAGSAPTFSGALIRSVNYAVTGTLSDVAASTADFYATATSPTGSSGDFLSEGDPVLFAQMKKWDTNVATNGTTHVATSGNLGTITSKPNSPWCSDPVGPSYNTVDQGWTMGGVNTIAVLVTYTI